ncbi:MAG: site-specific DNA-methyltransferase [Caulobacteraceae bacterium]|nr:site-specific DNA-methyltransferase [Caulobacteraceae bacterium]
MTHVIDQKHGANWTAYNADCVDVLSAMPSDTIGFSVFSPPFAHLFVYSDSPRDMGNVSDEAEFKALYEHVARELYRVTKPGRLVAVHCSDLPRTKSMHGVVGLYDFPADIREAHERAGWTYHSRITVWKDPVVEMQRTKALGLLYKQIQTDATRNRQGMPDYVLVFRKTPEDETKVDRVGQDAKQFPVDMWQQWASPVWMDINQTDVLNARVAREDKDERHLCPLQLPLIERCIRLWTNPGDVVFSPFMGIGSEGVSAIRTGRKFIGTELKPGYFNQAVRFLAEAEQANTATLFEAIA